ncbi:26S proteasome regulatory subunit N9 [Angomonas deanei]|nr:26S proteasome regulatory subunit N9 [Angomonas deanei]EPY26714.1 26S proteasome regulatory subunit N9 [Angomonas deanei]|eukprot:EPY26495.1 26S proteasome regulatory subunit N9 [Angomonas deanei]
MSQEEAQLYLTTISSFLQSNGDATNAALLDEASFFFQKRFYHELSEKLLEVFVLPKEVSPYLRESAYEINEKLFLPLRADISPFSYIKLTYFVCFSHLSSEDDRFNDNNFERALAVLDGAVVSLVAQQQEQGKHAAQCIRALLLLEEAFRSDTFQQVQTPHKGKEQQGTTMHTTQSSLQALAAVPGSGPHTARKILEEAEQFLSSLQSHEVEDVLLYFLYKARGKDYQLRKQFSEFYHNSFNMVLFAEKAQLSMSEAELTHLAYQSALSALLAENVFNVGRFLQFTPFTERLAPSSPCAWALEWLTLFDAGDVKGFAMFYNSHKDVIDREEDIRATLPQLLHKSRLMALLHLVFLYPYFINDVYLSANCGALQLQLPIN